MLGRRSATLSSWHLCTLWSTLSSWHCSAFWLFVYVEFVFGSKRDTSKSAVWWALFELMYCSFFFSIPWMRLKKQNPHQLVITASRSLRSFLIRLGANLKFDGWAIWCFIDHWICSWTVFKKDLARHILGQLRQSRQNHLEQQVTRSCNYIKRLKSSIAEGLMRKVKKKECRLPPFFFPAMDGSLCNWVGWMSATSFLFRCAAVQVFARKDSSATFDSCSLCIIRCPASCGDSWISLFCWFRSSWICHNSMSRTGTPWTCLGSSTLLESFEF